LFSYFIENKPMTSPSTNPSLVLLTVGHSNHEPDQFLQLLHTHSVSVLADVRSSPFSKFLPHFNQQILESHLKAHNIRYVFVGKELGGRPEGEQFYDEEGYVLYHRVAEAPFFRAGLDRLKTGLQRGYRIAIMCSEEDPSECHRCLLVTRVLSEEGVECQHIRGDGSLQSEQQVRDSMGDSQNQLVLFGEMENDSWKSIRSVLPKVQPPDSLLE